MATARLPAILVALFAAGCDGAKTVEAPSTSPAVVEYDNAPGTTLSYTRSNQDGTLPERVIMHVVSPTEVHVAKMVDRCTDAAYVTGVFDAATKEATRLVGGRLQRDGTQLPQVWLDFDPAARRLEVRFGDPASTPAETHTAPPAPWRMYDFDLSEFALFGPRQAKAFSFGLAMAWPDGTSPALRILGEATAVHAGAETLNGAAVNHYRLSGPAFADPEKGDRGGDLFLDAAYGHVVEARFGRPNHTEYTDFLLKLDSVARENGVEVWRDALAAHWKDCPA